MEGEREPSAGRTRRQFFRAAFVGTVAEATGWMDGLSTVLTMPEDNPKQSKRNVSLGMRLLGDAILLIAGGELAEKGEQGMKGMDRWDDDTSHMSQHRNENAQNQNETYNAESERMERRTITIFPPPEKPTDPEELVRKKLFESRANIAARAKLRKAILEAAVDVYPELKAYLDTGRRISVTREWRPRWGRPRTRLTFPYRDFNKYGG